MIVRLLLFALVLTACAGPRSPLDVGVREVPSDILLGAAEDEAEPAPPPAPIPPTAVSVVIPVAPPLPAPPAFVPTPPPLPPPPVPDPCPSADPLSAPRLEAPTDRAIEPAPGVFSYRNDGTFSVGGANANEGTFTDDTTREIRDVTEIDGGFEFVVDARLGGTSTATTYRVVNVGPADEPLEDLGVVDESVGRGLYIVAVESTDDAGGTTVFRPANPLVLLPVPAFAGDTFSASGTDPLTGTTMTYDGTVIGKQRVDACGEFLDAVRVELTDGRFVSPTANLEFAAIHDLATQFGGLSVQDLIEQAGTENAVPKAVTNHAVISDVPRQAPS